MASILDAPTSADGNTISFSVSAGTNRCLIVGVEQEGTTVGAPTCAYGGESMANVVDLEINPGTTSQRCTLFFLNDADIESAVGTTVTASNVGSVLTIHAASYEDCVQTTPGNTDSDSSTAATPNPLTDCDIVTGAANAVVVALAGMGNGGTAAWGGTLTERTEEPDGTATATGSLADDEVPSATTIAVECTWTTPNRQVVVALELVNAAVSYEMVGVTKDSDGSTLASVEVYLIKDNGDNTCTWIGYDLSDGSGNYVIGGIADNDSAYLVVGWKDDTPHVFDVGDHVLQPTLE